MQKPQETATKIRTTGELREFLANLLLGVRNGHVEPDAASRMTKIAAQINENFYAEIKVAKTRVEAGEQLAELGQIPINKKA